jgi:DHA1 family multidrug resistance protein-like MFS transporter
MRTIDRHPTFVLNLSVYLGAFGLAMTLPLLPILVDMHLDDQTATLRHLSHWSGLIVAATPLLVALSLPVWLHAARQGAGKWLMRILLVIAGVMLAAMGKAQGLRELLLLRGGLGLVGCMPILAMVVAPSLGMPRFAGRLSGLVRVMLLAALVLGPPMGGLLGKAIGVKMTFVTAGLISIVGGLILTMGFDHPLQAPAEPSPEETDVHWPTAQPTIWSGAMLLLQAGTAAVGPMLALHLLEGMDVEYSMVSTWSGVALGAMGLAGLVTSLCAELISDLLPIRGYLIVGCLMAAGLTWLMAHAGHVVDLVAWGMAWSGVMTALITLMLSAAGRHRTSAQRLSMIGWLAAAEPVGMALGPMIAGWGGAMKPQAIFTLSGIITLAAIPLITAMKIPQALPAAAGELGRFDPAAAIDPEPPASTPSQS